MMLTILSAKSAEQVQEHYKNLTDPWICQRVVSINQSTRYTIRALSVTCWLDNNQLGTLTIEDTLGPGQSAQRDIVALGWTVNGCQSSLLWTVPQLNGQWRAVTYPVYRAPPGNVYVSVGVLIKDPQTLTIGDPPELVDISDQAKKSAR